MPDYYTPGETARRFGVSLDTLRYYEREGLLTRVERGAGGHRRYRASDVELLDLVRCLRDTDMPIARLREFAELVREGDATVPRRVEVLERHEERLAERIAELVDRQAAIRHKIAYYRGVLAAAEDAEGAAGGADGAAGGRAPVGAGAEGRGARGSEG
ncbi:MerR family transcriptional regulator [Nocardiopsis trehalosi]|uniref:MerR family transcriptional regulator n=1 Tax=Nocardiopsis trehalosi TaxID=109329 RepID=UPI000A033346|nr:MerR family transcriptional regulator [Nocardiopsis trehalosi]